MMYTMLAGRRLVSAPVSVGGWPSHSYRVGRSPVSARNPACGVSALRRDGERPAGSSTPHLRVIHLERGGRQAEELAGKRAGR